jgi:hypothetical protein
LSIKVNICVISNMQTDALMLLEIKIKKDKLLESTTSIMVPTRDGRSSILTRRQRLRLRVLMRNSVSTLTDHST